MYMKTNVRRQAQELDDVQAAQLFDEMDVDNVGFELGDGERRPQPALTDKPPETPITKEIRYLSFRICLCLCLCICLCPCQDLAASLCGYVYVPSCLCARAPLCR